MVSEIREKIKNNENVGIAKRAIRKRPDVTFVTLLSGIGFLYTLRKPKDNQPVTYNRGYTGGILSMMTMMGGMVLVDAAMDEKSLSNIITDDTPMNPGD